MKDKLLRLFKNEGFKKYAFNTGWLFAEQILRLVSGLFVGVWVARYLGPELFGIYSYAVSFVALFGVIASLGLHSIVVRELIKEPHQQKKVLGTAFYLQIIGAIVVVLLISAVLPFTSNTTVTNVYILILSGGLLFQPFQVIDYYFQSKVLSKYVSICRLVQLFASSVLKIYFVLVHADLLYFVLIILFDHISLALTLSFAYWKQKGDNFFKSFDWVSCKFLLRESWPLVVSSLVIMIYMRIDQVMIKEMMSASAVGIYSAAVRLSEVWYFVPVLISQSLFPAVLSAKKINERLYRVRLQRLLNLMMGCSLLVALVLSLSSGYVIKFLYGPGYAAAAAVLSVQVWAGIAVASGVVTSNWFVVEGLQKYAMYRTGAGALANILLNLLLIPKYGIIGSAFATLFSQFIASILLNGLFKHTWQIFLLQLKAIAGLGLWGNRMVKEVYIQDTVDREESVDTV